MFLLIYLLTLPLPYSWAILSMSFFFSPFVLSISLPVKCHLFEVFSVCECVHECVRFGKKLIHVHLYCSQHLLAMIKKKKFVHIISGIQWTVESNNLTL